MNAATALGAIGMVIGLVRALPQLLRLRKMADAHGVSLDAAATSCVVSLAWAIYGALTEQWAVALASALTATVFALVAVLASKLGRKVKELRAAPLWFAAVTVALVLAGSAGLGVVLVLGALVANTPQVIVAFRERDLTGLSPSTWALTASDGAVWTLYGIVTGDIPILVNNLFQFSTSLAILVRRLLWGRRRTSGGHDDAQHPRQLPRPSTPDGDLPHEHRAHVAHAAEHQ